LTRAFRKIKELVLILNLGKAIPKILELDPRLWF
jgi:hypothetical protein